MKVMIPEPLKYISEKTHLECESYPYETVTSTLLDLAKEARCMVHGRLKVIHIPKCDYSARDARPLLVHNLSFSCSFRETFGPNNRLEPSFLELAPLLGNPGSATVNS